MASTRDVGQRQRRILVTGCSGYVGQFVLRQLMMETEKMENNYKVYAHYGHNNEFVQAAALRYTMGQRLELKTFSWSSDDHTQNLQEQLKRISPEVVVHLAAMSSPGQCEKNPELAKQVNVAQALWDNLPPTCRRIVALSTDQVYDGKKGSLYNAATDEARPINVYGQSKREMEEYLLRLDQKEVIILRSSLILGPKPPLMPDTTKGTFLHFIQSRLKSQESTSFFSNEYRSVICVKDVVNVILHFIARPGSETRIYNMGGPDRISRSDLALQTAKHLKLSSDCIQAVERPPAGHNNPPDISMDSTPLEEATPRMNVADTLAFTFPDSDK